VSQTGVMPPLEICMGCHRVAGSGLEPVEALRGMWDTGATIEWDWVYKLPEFVQFNHAPHLRNGVECEEGVPRSGQGRNGPHLPVVAPHDGVVPGVPSRGPRRDGRRHRPCPLGTLSTPGDAGGTTAERPVSRPNRL
jgi:hypothetical protein